MRSFMSLVERMNIPLHQIPRAWIGPSGQVIECDEDISHSDTVVANKEVFGITPEQEEHFYNHAEFYPEDGDETPPVFFDVVIATAEVNGWTRISRDSRGNNIAISSSSLSGIRKAVRWLISQNVMGFGVEFEIETVSDGAAERLQYGVIPEESVEMFAKTGAIPRKRF